MKNNLIKTYINNFVKNDIIINEQNIILSSSLYHYFCLKYNINTCTPKTFNLLFSKMCQVIFNKKLKRARLYNNNTTYWYLEGFAIKNPFNFSINFLNEKAVIANLLNVDNNINTELINIIKIDTLPTIIEKNEIKRASNIINISENTIPFKILKGSDYFKFVKNWVVEYTIYKENSESLTSELINDYCQKYLNGYIPEHTNNQFFIKELKKVCKEHWPNEKEVINSNPSGKKGKSLIHNLQLK